MRLLVRFGSVLAIILLSATGCSPQTSQPGALSATAEAAQGTKVYLPMIASLWLNRPENPAGVHEIKVMAADGSAYFMALVDADVVDLGLGCGGVELHG